MLSEFSEQQMESLITAFRQQLQQLGWSEDNIRIDPPVGGVNAAQLYVTTAALVASAPDVIVALGSRAAGSLKEATQTIPVVFTLVSDPVPQKLVKSLAQPGGNITGVMNYDFSFAGKWLEALKEIEPRISRVLVMGNPQNPGTGELSRFVEGLGPSYGVVIVPAPVRNIADIEDALAGFGEGIDRAIMVLPDDLVVNHRDLVIPKINRARIPAVYPFRIFAVSGGLLSWGWTMSRFTGRQRCTSIAFSVAQNPLTFRYSHPTNSMWSSISKRLKNSNSKFRRCCLRSPTT
jgi:putative ABC transport system substrate-binding protein